MSVINEELTWKCSGCGKFHKVKVIVQRLETFIEDEKN